jgi:hypothetical protein
MKKVFFFLNVSDRVVVTTLVTVFAIALMAVFLTSCSREDCPELPDARLEIGINGDSIADLATIHFVCRGDFEIRPFTRSLEADGKSMTDLWVLDYIGTTLAQQIHQVSTDEDFGTPTLNLSVGSHHIYFIASRGQDATIDTDAHTITFGKVRDTFYMDYEINVTATSNGSRSVTLERIVTKFTAIITDAIPEGAATFNMIPSQWYYGWDYVAGTPTTATTSQAITINIPASEIGKTDELLSIFGFSSDTEWTTDITLDCKKADRTILGSAVLANVPLKRNRITEYTGPLFSSNGLTTVGLSTDWDTEYVGTW